MQKILGHYSIRTTARYTHLTKESNEQADERIDALRAGFCIGWGTLK